MDKNIPDKILQEVSIFPSMPKAGMKLRSLLAKEDVSVAEIEKILRQDPGLAANVLRLANSPFFGLPSKVGTLKHAVTLLGVKRFSKIAVGACMDKTMDVAVPGYGLSQGKLWLHSIAVSNTAEALARYRKLDEAGDYFTPALLHDLGKLVLAHFVNRARPEIDELLSKGVPLVIAEKEILGTDHAEIGALILSKWSFPKDLINAVRWHHYPEAMADSGLHSEIVYLANLMCQSNSGGESAGDQPNEPYSSVLERLGLKPEQYFKFAEKTRSWQEKLSETLVLE